MIVSHPSAFQQYVDHGWCVVPIPPKTKGPQHFGWDTKEACICDSKTQIPEGWGAGIAHAYCGTCAIDIDQLFAASMLFAERGLNIYEYLNAPDAVQIISGRPGSAKLIYSIWMPLPSKKLNLAGQTALEFRCAPTGFKSLAPGPLSHTSPYFLLNSFVPQHFSLFSRGGVG
jgi:hypothetical protein